MPIQRSEPFLCCLIIRKLELFGEKVGIALFKPCCEQQALGARIEGQELKIEQRMDIGAKQQTIGWIMILTNTPWLDMGSL